MKKFLALTIKYFIDKAKRSRFVQNLFEAPFDLQKFKKFGEFQDSLGNKYELLNGFRSKIKPGWENMLIAKKRDITAEQLMKLKNNAEIAFGNYLSGEGELSSPTQIELTTDHRVLVSDAIVNGIFIYDYFGNFLNKITNNSIKQAVGITIDNKNRIYLTDLEGAAIYIFTINGKLIERIDLIGGLLLKQPRDIAIYHNKSQEYEYNLYIIDGDLVKIAGLKYSK